MKKKEKKDTNAKQGSDYWAGLGYCIVSGRLRWLKRTQPNSPEIPHLEETVQGLEIRLKLSGRLG